MVIFLFSVAGCGIETEVVKEEYDHYTFDQQLIAKLPLYDSLVTAVIKNFSSFQKYIKDEDSYRAFRYRPASDDPDVFKKLPTEVAPIIDSCFTRIGKDLIYGFDVFKDSSVKIYVRTRVIPGSEVDILENLSYYSGGNIRDRIFPEKDTTLNKNWQYWAWFGKQGLF